MNTQATVTLKPGRERSLLRHHPWVFSGAIARVAGTPEPGETVLVRAADGRQCGLGAWSPASQMRVRMWTFDTRSAIDSAFLRNRLSQALDMRRSLWGLDETSACRLVYAESDGLPGVVVDRYGPWLVCQFLSAGAEYWRDTIVAELIQLTGAGGVYERSDSSARAKEGLQARTGPLSDEEPPTEIEIREDDCRYLVDIRNGHKTGFYLDQRVNRLRVARLARGAAVLNCFSYTGGFGTAALAGGASTVTDIDSSDPALERAGRIDRLNGFDEKRVEYVPADAFGALRSFRDARREFDMVILDPPKFVENRAQLEPGCRGYKDINLLGCKLLKPGGLLVTFSCSGLVAPELFQKIVADAALDAGREAQILEWLNQAPDHPVALPFPEARYLKGLLVRVA
ncbi:MAG: 23S rRNA (cytosine(1962)-C(5))-methyltransferase RlmI [Chitinivibrionales bacterium]|nr:23S rRNA (cytosine(1962)-C(5))-methyltransferase RlmI [Chitinivibrionales bacterium]